LVLLKQNHAKACCCFCLSKNTTCKQKQPGD
jgi:hypothetical protein